MSFLTAAPGMNIKTNESDQYCISIIFRKTELKACRINSIIVQKQYGNKTRPNIHVQYTIGFLRSALDLYVLEVHENMSFRPIEPDIP